MADQAISDLTIKYDAASARRITCFAVEWCWNGIPRYSKRQWCGCPCRRNRRDGSRKRDHPSKSPLRRHHLLHARSLRFLSGSDRTGLPVAAKMAFITAGAATMIVGSPTPPQKPPDGTVTVSTLVGKSAMRIIS